MSGERIWIQVSEDKHLKTTLSLTSVKTLVSGEKCLGISVWEQVSGNKCLETGVWRKNLDTGVLLQRPQKAFNFDIKKCQGFKVEKLLQIF